MATIANNIQKILRHHIPLIRFKYGANQSDSAVHASNEKKTDSKPTGATSSTKPIQKSVSLEFSQTPKKYRRRPLNQEEIDLVTIGGFT
jgi:hypothetical protein